MPVAVAYYRTSSAANVGADKDSLRRQQEAVRAHADAHGLEIVGEFHDAAVSGADHLGDRPGFAELLARATSPARGTILVESASRFARDLIVQETGFAMLKGRASSWWRSTTPTPSPPTPRRRAWCGKSRAR